MQIKITKKKWAQPEGIGKRSVHVLLNQLNQQEQISRQFGIRLHHRQMVKKIQDLSSIKKGYLANLINFANSIQNLVIAMQSLGWDNHLMNPQLLKDMVLKNNMKLKWEEKAISLMLFLKFCKLDGSKGRSC